LEPSVLQVWNTSGVASVIAKFSDRAYGTRSTVITRKKMDRAGLTTYGRAYDDGAKVFFARALLMARKYDIVQVQALDRIVPWLKRIYPSKPVLMQYLGTDIQDKWKEKEPRWSHADKVTYCTPNLGKGAPAEALYVPIPVDTDLFHPLGGPRDPDSALSFRYGMDAEAEEAANSRSLKLTMLDRWTVPHHDMPALLSRYAYYIDMRRPPGYIEARSVGKAALEALASGCKVIDWSGKIVEGLPKENDPVEVARRWHDLYAEVLSKR
jgi:hypothetical protein